MTRFAVVVAVLVAFGPLTWLAPHARAQDSQPNPCAAPVGSPDPDNVHWTKISWAMYTVGDYAGAIRNVQACIAIWEPIARGMQDSMDRREEPQPITGHPPDDATRNAVLGNGLLNDVGTNLFILAHSYAAIGNHPRETRSAFERCVYLSRARTWDPRSGGFFWAPVEQCAARLAQLN